MRVWCNVRAIFWENESYVRIYFYHFNYALLLAGIREFVQGKGKHSGVVFTAAAEYPAHPFSICREVVCVQCLLDRSPFTDDPPPLGVAPEPAEGATSFFHEDL